MVFNFVKRLAIIPSFLKQGFKPVTPVRNTVDSISMSESKLCTKPIVWIDCEMTGLDLHKDRLMEIACVVTDHNLNVIAEGPNIVINQPDSLLTTMDSWCTNTHTKTGLLQACRDSKITEQQAEDVVLTFIKKYVKIHEAPLAGNTIYMDRLFLREQMPKIDKYLHYRVIDVSSIKELCRRWNTTIYDGTPSKKLSHRALDDILETIEELKYYRRFMFVNPS